MTPRIRPPQHPRGAHKHRGQPPGGLSNVWDGQPNRWPPTASLTACHDHQVTPTVASPEEPRQPDLFVRLALDNV
ncbi:hypothetical protein PtB15_12B490 [Puccinia triticina]|nr:hypothetical protein PtB15_12B490 [Puccinia triticina]